MRELLHRRVCKRKGRLRSVERFTAMEVFLLRNGFKVVESVDEQETAIRCELPRR